MKKFISPHRAAVDVMNERKRQIDAEGWTPRHDDLYPGGDLAEAAACYAWASNADPTAYPKGCPPDMWPWDVEFWKPCDERRMLVKAGALILAEIERLDRAEATNQQA